MSEILLLREYRVYIKPLETPLIMRSGEVNGYPVGYVQTFKVVSCKRRERK